MFSTVFPKGRPFHWFCFPTENLKKGIETDPLMQNEQNFPIYSLFMIQFSGLGQRQYWVDSWTSNLKRFLPTVVILWFYYIDSTTIQILELLDLGACWKTYSLFSEKGKCANEVRAVLAYWYPSSWKRSTSYFGKCTRVWSSPELQDSAEQKVRHKA